MRESNGSVSTVPDILIITPWLQGGGGQKALQGVLRDLPRERLRLVVLFDQNRETDSVREDVAEMIFLNCRRSVTGILRARKMLDPYLRSSGAVYSLMRGSHLVLGVGAIRHLQRRRFAATFHQLPSEDAKAVFGAVEDWLVRRATRRAGLVTAPSRRAVEEIVARRLAEAENVFYESNVSDANSHDVVPPRDGVLNPVRLLFAGRLSEQKGIDRIREMLTASSTPIELRIAGRGELGTEVDRIAADMPDPHRVEVIGHTDRLVEEIDWADALFMPSRWELNPMTVWEAWARGRPVIASDLPVFHDLAEVGPITTYATAASFARAIDALAGSAEYRRSVFTLAMAAFSRHSEEGRRLARFLAS